jgi:thiamine-monophosphate kinase
MSDSEFDIIEKYFTPLTTRDDVVLGVGDDAALLKPPAGKQLVMTMDTLIAGVHFPAATCPEDIAYKSIAVNLSDLAAMGAEPAWLMLSLSLPDVDTHWLTRFSQSFQTTCTEYAVQLIGGDTTKGPLSISVQATGLIDADKTIRRDAAQVGDLILVTGTLGDAALALELFDTDRQCDELLARLNRPMPRLAFAMEAVQYCRCGIDISDGLLADLSHITQASNCGAELRLADIPLSESYIKCYENNISVENMTNALTGGDDYELCLTVCSEQLQQLTQIARKHAIRLSVIGVITAEDGIRCINRNGQPVDKAVTGYKHF